MRDHCSAHVASAQVWGHPASAAGLFIPPQKGPCSSLQSWVRKGFHGSGGSDGCVLLSIVVSIPLPSRVARETGFQIFREVQRPVLYPVTAAHFPAIVSLLRINAVPHLSWTWRLQNSGVPDSAAQLPLLCLLERAGRRHCGALGTELQGTRTSRAAVAPSPARWPEKHFSAILSYESHGYFQAQRRTWV